MVILVIGGSGSGKSEYAESCCVKLNSKMKFEADRHPPLIYVATMEPFDEESYARIEKHRNMRKGKGFETVECYTHLEDVMIPEGCTVLLECMSNLVANEMFSDSGRKDDTARVILGGVANLIRQAEHVVIVTNQVFSDGITYEEGTDDWLRVLAKVNNRVAKMADIVCEVVHGIPVLIKGECLQR